MQTAEQVPVAEEQNEKIHLPEAYIAWADLLLGAWEESKDSALEQVKTFWETYSPLDATALLFELNMAANGIKMPHYPGESALDQYHHDLTVVLAAFYRLTVPACEWMELAECPSLA